MPILRLLARLQTYRTIRLRIGSKTLNAMVADTVLKRAIGLMHRKKLKSNECMLFIFGRGSRYGIWMLNMRFSIDIIWLDEKKRVVDFAKNLKPCKNIFDCKTSYPKRASRYIIELNAGFIEKNKFPISKRVSFQI